MSARCRWCESKALKKSTFAITKLRAVQLHAMAREPIDRSARQSALSRGQAVHENNFAKVLTLEKTVIRFRPADVTCGRE